MNALQIMLLNTGVAYLNGDWNWKGVSSPFSRLYYIISGSAKIKLLSGTYELKPHYLYFIPPFTLFDCICEQTFSHYYIHIYEKQFPNISILEELSFPFELKASDLDVLLIQRIIQINPGRELNQYDPDVYDNSSTLLKNLAEDIHQSQYICMETRGILNQLISHFLRLSSPKIDTSDIRILKVLSFIRNNIYTTIKICQLSEICSLSDDHFIRLFKKEMKCTPIHYINQKKIEKAQQMLLIENSSVKDIAYRLAFQNVSHFNRVFKQFTNSTPTSQYRKIRKT